MKQHFFTLLLLLLGATVAFGQQEISGKVTDKNGEALIGASVMVKGTNNLVISSIDGTFKISADPNATLVVSYTGFATFEEAIKGRTDITVALSPGIDLDEMLVTGYGTALKGN